MKNNKLKYCSDEIFFTLEHNVHCTQYTIEHMDIFMSETEV